jgi:phage I-like protein
MDGPALTKNTSLIDPRNMKPPFRTIPFEIVLGEAAASSAPEIPRRVRLLKTGTYYDPRYGTFTFTPDFLRAVKKNFDDKVLGVDPAIDLSHDSDKEAAGWPKGLELANGDTELWADVEWTPLGETKLRSKEFRYISADIAGNFEDNKTRRKHGPTLRGAGLTNRPVLKDLGPVIQLTEGKGNEEMEDKERIAELEKQLAELNTASAAKDIQLSEATQKADKLEADAKKLEDEKKLAEKTAKFDELLKAGKFVEAQRQAFMDGDVMKLAELAQPVKLITEGHGGEGADSTNADEAQSKIIKLAQEKVSKKEAPNFETAVSMVLSENQELKKAYQA